MKIICLVFLNLLFVICKSLTNKNLHRIARAVDIEMRCISNCNGRTNEDVVFFVACDMRRCPQGSVTYLSAHQKITVGYRKPGLYINVGVKVFRSSGGLEFMINYRGERRPFFFPYRSILTTSTTLPSTSQSTTTTYSSTSTSKSTSLSSTFTTISRTSFPLIVSTTSSTKSTTSSTTAKLSSYTSSSTSVTPTSSSTTAKLSSYTSSSSSSVTPTSASTTKKLSTYTTSSSSKKPITSNTTAKLSSYTISSTSKSPTTSRTTMKISTTCPPSSTSRPTYIIHCNVNCPIARTEEDTTLSVICLPNCSVPQVHWETKPVIPTIIFADNNQNIVIPKNTVTEEIKVLVFCRIDGETLNYTVSFVPPPILKLICKSNCWVVNYIEPVILEAQCIKYCTTDQFKWRGAIVPSCSLYGARKEYLIVPPKTLDSGMSYKVSVTLDGRSETTEVLQVDLCKLIPTTGISGKTKFRIQCPFVIDKEMLIFQQTDITSDDHGLLIYDGKRDTNSEFYLSAGENTRVIIMILNSSYIQNITVSVLPMFISGDPRIRQKVAEEYNKIIKGINKDITPDYIQQLSAFLKGLRLSSPDQLKYYTTKILKDISQHISQMPPLPAVTLLSEIAKMDEANNGFAKNLLSDNLLKIVDKATTIDRFSPDKLNLFVNRVYEVASSIANKSHEMEEDTKVDNFNQEYKTYDMNYKRISTIHHMRESTMNVITALEKVGTLMDTNNNPFTYISVANGMTSTTQRLHNDDQIIEPLNIGSRIKISKDAMTEINSERDAYIHVTSLSNLFWWHSKSDDINSELLMINIYSNGKKINQLKKSQLDLLISTQADPSSFLSIKGDLIKDVSVVHKITIKSLTFLDFTFMHFGFDYTILLSYTFPSTKQIKNKGFTIRNLTVITRKMKNVTKNVYIGVARWLGDKPTYGIIIRARKCLSFASNKLQWSPKGCQVGNESDDSTTHCICNHFSVFGTSFFVPPNKIQILKLSSIKEALRRSSTMFYVVIVLLTTYLFLMIYAYRLDRKCEILTTVDNLPDIIPGKRIMYILCVETTMFHDVPTARIIIEIHGEKGKSDRHFLNGRKHFLAGSEDWFSIFTSTDLGPLVSIRLFHDSAGLQPNWFCDKITIQRPDTAKIYVFSVRNWFSPLYGDGKTDRIIPLTVMTNIREGRIRVPYRIRSKFRDDFLFASIFARPSGSTFTSKERLTVYFVMILLSMVTGAMFFGKKAIFDEEGTFSLGWEDAFVYLESMAITIPVGIILILLFKCARPYKAADAYINASGRLKK